jgi:hypothetical protein
MENTLTDDEKRIYNIYYQMMDRCKNFKSKSYGRYGGRGIKVCDEWINDRNAFIEWAKNNGYQDGLQIDRINNDGNYEPSNCRWVTLKENCRNTSRTIRVEINGGEIKPLISLCEEMNIPVDRIRNQISRDRTRVSEKIAERQIVESYMAKQRRIKELAAIIDKHLCFVHVIRPY